MASKTFRFCDRCKKEIRYLGWTAKIKRIRKFHIHEIFNGNPDGYSYCDSDFELCSDCTRGLEKFLMNRE